MRRLIRSRLFWIFTVCKCMSEITWGRLDLAVLFTPSTPNRHNRNQVCWNTCAGVCRSTPSSKVVRTEQSRDLFQNKMAEHCLHCTEIFFSSDIYLYWKNMVISKMDWKHIYFVILFSSSWRSDCVFFTIQTVIAWFTPEYSKVPNFACFWWLFWRTPHTLKLLNQVSPWCRSYMILS